MEADRKANVVLVWVLSVMLAMVFLCAGVPKILGTSTIALQAAAMRGFPPWIRGIVGVAEIAGAIALLIPALSVYAAVALALFMIPATITQIISGEPGIMIPVVTGVLLLVLAWRRDPARVSDAIAQVRRAPHPILREGVVAGRLGATCIAVWFFVVDLLAGHAFFTPITLGQAVLSAFNPSDVAALIGYTVFHYAAFIVTGIIAAVFVKFAHREPSLLLGFAVFFAAFEVGFYAFVALLQQASALGTLAWYQVMIGNLIASVAMGVYMVRAHPMLGHHFRHALDAPVPVH